MKEIIIILLVIANFQYINAQRIISIGTLENFEILASSAITNTGPSLINGNLGLSPGSSVTGFPPGIVIGNKEIANAKSALARTDLFATINKLKSLSCGLDLSGVNLGGLILTPGVYCFSSSAQLTGTLVLNNLGISNPLFVFKISSSLTTASNSMVVSLGSACNVFWQVGSSATLGTKTEFFGNILASTSVTLTTGAINEGKVFAANAAITLDANIIKKSECATNSPTIPSLLPTTNSPTLKPSTKNPTTTKNPTRKPSTSSPTKSNPSLLPTTTGGSISPTIKPSTSSPTFGKTPTKKPSTLNPTNLTPSSSPNSITLSPTVFNSISPLSIRPSLSPTIPTNVKLPTKTPTKSPIMIATCYCKGDPHCESFSGKTDDWVECNGYVKIGKTCQLKKSKCESQTDKDGLHCIYKRGNQDVKASCSSSTTSKMVLYQSSYSGLSIHFELYLGDGGSIDKSVILFNKGAIIFGVSNCKNLSFTQIGELPESTTIDRDLNTLVITILNAAVTLKLECVLGISNSHLDAFVEDLSGLTNESSGFCSAGVIIKGQSTSDNIRCENSH